MSDIKVSIIIPVHNAEKYLNKCLDSVINQTLQNIEIICINDDSTDKSLKILEQYQNNDKRIKIINTKCHCSGGARNKGLEVATGEYIGFIDADDWIDNDYFEKLYNLAVELSADIAATSSVKVIRNGELIYQKEMGATPLKNPVDSLLKKANCITTTGICCNKIYKTSMLRKYNIEFLELNNPSEDNYFNACSIIAANKLMFLDDSSYYYNYVDSSQTKKKKTQKDFQMTSVYKKIIEKIYTFKMDEDITQDWINVVKKRLANDVLVYCEEMNKSLQKQFLKHVKNKFPDIQIYLPKKNKAKEFIQQVFSLKNENINNQSYKCLRFLGLRILFKQKKKQKPDTTKP